MALWLKILIVILAVHYLLAITVLFFVLKDNLRAGVKISRAKLICWNLAVLLLPILGPIAYLVYRVIAKPQNTTIANMPTTTNTTDNTDSLDKNESQKDDDATNGQNSNSTDRTASSNSAELDKNRKMNDEDN